MDWFSWLSKTNLDPSLIYDYGLVFARNELQREDLRYFNHEFLQSMGITVAKHRLEILKLVKRESESSPQKGFSKIVLALNRTKRSISKCINKLLDLNETERIERVESVKALPEPKKQIVRVEKPVMKPRRVVKSGPIDGRLYQEKMMMINGGGGNGYKNLKLSGPLDRERLVFAYRSPISSGPINRSPMSSGPLDRRPPSPRVYSGDGGKEKFGYDDHTLWAALFQDLKPT